MIDHFILACSDGERGAEVLAETFDVRLAPGGSHAGRGTRNHLGSFGDCYLELLSPDPEQDNWRELASSMPDHPSLLTWCARSGNLDELAEAARSLDFSTIGPESWRRDSPAGPLTWRLLFLRAHDYKAAMPFFIDWGTTTTPAETAPKIGGIAEFSISAPNPDRLRKLLTSNSTTVSLKDSPLSMSLAIASKNGTTTFETATPFPDAF